MQTPRQNLHSSDLAATNPKPIRTNAAEMGIVVQREWHRSTRRSFVRHGSARRIEQIRVAGEATQALSCQKELLAKATQPYVV